jgi:hypothetical protein
MKMGVVRVALVAIVSVAVLAVGVTAAGADAGAEAEFVSRINGARASQGKGALTTDSELTGIARRWAQRMADDQRLSHNPNLSREVSQDWEKLAENVGFGQEVGQIHEAFMNSAAHRANILDGALTHVGVGVVIDGSGQMWVTEVFMRLRGGGGSPPTTAAPPPPPPTTSPPPPPPTSPPTTRAPRPVTTTVPRTAPPPTTPRVTAPPTTSAPAPPPTEPEPVPEPETVATAQPLAPTPRLVLVLDGLRALDGGR